MRKNERHRPRLETARSRTERRKEEKKESKRPRPHRREVPKEGKEAFELCVPCARGKGSKAQHDPVERNQKEGGSSICLALPAKRPIRP